MISSYKGFGINFEQFARILETSQKIVQIHGVRRLFTRECLAVSILDGNSPKSAPESHKRSKILLFTVKCTDACDITPI